MRLCAIYMQNMMVYLYVSTPLYIFSCIMVRFIQHTCSYMCCCNFFLISSCPKGGPILNCRKHYHQQNWPIDHGNRQQYFVAWQPPTVNEKQSSDSCLHILILLLQLRHCNPPKETDLFHLCKVRLFAFFFYGLKRILKFYFNKNGVIVVE